ncbi:MAG TPA: hypothetical protein DIS62_01370 [Candidatus Kerfeldbacteria bacterium]|nr:hypothetical protein [Candidatus Kerfeldbacteria bacterium]
MYMPRPGKYSRTQRFQWYQQVDHEHRSVSEVCRIFGVSRKCYYHWRARDYGLLGNRYRSPQLQPNLKLTYEVRKFIEEHKRIANYGPLKMKLLIKKELALEVSTTIIYRYFKRKKLIRRPQKRLPWYEPMKEALYITQPGQGIQMDVKYVYEAGARRYQFSVFDPYTKKYHFTVYRTKESKNAIAALKRARRYFGFKVLSIQTDNGSEFRGIFHRWLTAKGIPHYFIPKKSPWWNGNVERVHRTIDDEYYQNPQRVWRTAYEWLAFYNFERIHLSLNGLTPQEKLLQSVTIDC